MLTLWAYIAFYLSVEGRALSKEEIRELPPSVKLLGGVVVGRGAPLIFLMCLFQSSILGPSLVHSFKILCCTL